MRRWVAGAAASLALASCAPVQLPTAPVPYGDAITIAAAPVPLHPGDPSLGAIGNFVYAGGVHLTSAQTARLHGFSDLKIWPDGRVLALGDQSDLLTARLVLDTQGRLAGLADARISALKDENGVDLYAGGQREFDSEGIAQLANGDRVVSFEQHDRMLRFPANGGLPVAAPFPDIKYQHNSGMEALAAAPDVAADAYRVGIEPTGEIFLCRLSAACVKTGQIDLEGLELVGMEHLPGGGAVYLLRDYKPVIGNTVRIQVVDRNGVKLDGMKLGKPFTIDNFEGIGAVPLRGGGFRFYIISDDNFGTYAGLPTDQRTLLLAFDWRPPNGRKP